MNIPKTFSRAFLAAAAIFLIFFSGFVALITDWWWFSGVGFTEIFTKSLVVKFVLGLAVGVFSTAFLLINFLIAVRSKIPWMMAVPAALAGRPLAVNDRTVKKTGNCRLFNHGFFYRPGCGRRLAGCIEISFGRAFRPNRSALR